jgi:hypothetical protein
VLFGDDHSFGKKIGPRSIYFNPEMAGGQGLSSTLGIAGFPNGETFEVDQTEGCICRPHFYGSKLIWIDILTRWMME